MTQKPKIFISSAAEDRGWSSSLSTALRKQGVDVVFDQQHIQPGEAWIDTLQDALSNSTHVVFVVTPQSTNSSWIAAELGAALAQHKPMVSVVSSDTNAEDLPAPLRTRRHIELGDPSVVAMDIVSSIESE